MTRARQGTPGKTRTCPHCRTRILESAQICPACRHHLRFDPAGQGDSDVQLTPLAIEGTIQHPARGEAWEYSVVVTVRNERGAEIARHVVDVGAIKPNEARTFSLSVDVNAPPGTTLGELTRD
jgi:hypothetical protein